MTVAERVRGEEILAHERGDAWFEYLEQTRGQSELRYEEIEPWAWSRLVSRLRAIDTRASKLAEPARGQYAEDDGA